MATTIEIDDVPVIENVGRRSSSRLQIFVALVVAVLIAGSGGAYWYFFQADIAPDEVASTPDTFVDVPAMLVNLRSADGNGHILKLHFVLVPTSPAKGEEIKTRLPVIIDAYQPFLRELRPEDLAGSAAVFRIKEEMLSRANAVIGAGSVKDVLIQDLTQQ